MNTVANLSLQIESEMAVAALWQAAEILDAVDQAQVLPDANRYQEAARLAVRLLNHYGELPRVERLCRLSPALLNLYANYCFEKKFRGGFIPDMV